MGTKYNILYNGNLALENGRNTINDAFTDNFWELLPVERMQVTDEIMLPGNAKNEDFQYAEEKAIKAVQMHGMNIQGKEKNPQIDEAYLLLGQARYFDQRFIPALEAFNYILYKYPASDKINQAKVWREKANIRLDNNELAIKNLKKLLDSEVLEDQDLADVTAIMAMAYINTKAKDSALTMLDIAAANTKKHNEVARYNYIRGQIFDHFQQTDSANVAYDKVIDLNRKVSRAYYINAHLSKVNNFDVTSSAKDSVKEFLRDMEVDRENRPFLDKLYYTIAEFHNREGSDFEARAFYKKSIETKTNDKELLVRNYSNLGDIYFDITEYRTAGAYYDSTLMGLKQNSKRFRTFKRKRDNLEDVIFYEEIAQRNDSILHLVNLSDEERLVWFQAYTEKLQLEETLRREKEEIEALQKANSGGMAAASNTNQIDKKGGRPNVGGVPAIGKSIFYFYNPSTVAYGKNEFLKLWGNRPPEDNWRLSNKIGNINVEGPTNEITINEDRAQFDPEFYISQIPTDNKVIDSLYKERNFADYQLGGIYKEKFKEYQLAKSKYQRVLKSNPETRLILPSKYNLYQLYELLGESDEAQITKDDILTNHSDSRYAEILRNPKTRLAQDENSPEVIYESVFEAYQNQDYQAVISACEEHIFTFQGEPMVPKFEILKASAIARLYGFERYKESVNYIALTYPNSEEGKKANTILSQVIPSIANKAFVSDDEASSFKVIYQFDAATKEDIKAFKTELDKAIEAADLKYLKLFSSIDIYNPQLTFITVHGLKSINGADGFGEILSETKFKINKPYFVISTPNYEIVQMHKNLNTYLESQ